MDPGTSSRKHTPREKLPDSTSSGKKTPPITPPIHKKCHKQDSGKTQISDTASTQKETQNLLQGEGDTMNQEQSVTFFEDVDEEYRFAGPQTKKLLRCKHNLRKRVFLLCIDGLKKKKEIEKGKKENREQEQIIIEIKENAVQEKREFENRIKTLQDGISLVRQTRDAAHAEVQHKILDLKQRDKTIEELEQNIKQLEMGASLQLFSKKTKT